MQKYNVIVVGSGITGLSTVYHLTKNSVQKVALFNDHTVPPTRGAGYIFGSLFDNFTRFSHAYGLEVAKQVYLFTQRAAQSLISFCATNSISMHCGQHMRLIVSDSELLEARKAVSLLQQAGIDGRISAPPAFASSHVLAVQKEGASSACVDEAMLLAKLQTLADVEFINKRVEHISKGTKSECQVQVDKSIYQSEMLVLACHQQIGMLLPQMQEVVIPYSDQWGEYQVEANPFAVGDVFTANHGLEWGMSVASTRIRLGGARFLRPLAGIGEIHSRVSKKVSSYLAKRFCEYVPAFGNCKHLHSFAGSGIRPCDELPLISPMFGNERILLATGYMGSGLALGFMAGKCLAQLISTGKCGYLPTQLQAKRLRG